MLSLRFALLACALTLVAALPCGAAPSEDEKTDVKDLVQKCIKYQLPKDPYSAGDIGRKLAKEPKAAAEAVGSALADLDPSKEADYQRIEAGIDLLSGILHEASLKELDKLHARARKDKGANSVSMRYRLIKALDHDELVGVTTLLDAQKDKALPLLEKWLNDEEKIFVLKSGLCIFAERADELPPWLLAKVKGKVPDRVIERAQWRARINGAKDYDGKVREALAWIKELIADAQKGELGEGEVRGAGSSPTHFIWFALRDNLKALSMHAQPFEEKVRLIDQKLKETDDKIKAGPPEKELKRLETAKEQLTSLRTWLTGITDEIKSPSRDK